MSDVERFNSLQQNLCSQHELLMDGTYLSDPIFADVMTRFTDGEIRVELLSSVLAPNGLQTLSLHHNAAGVVILVHDSSAGRRYHFPRSWIPGQAAKQPATVHVNAWSRFSNTPTGRPSGYKQQRFSNSPKLFYQSARIISINDISVEDTHAGKALYAALKQNPDGVQLTLIG